MALAVIATLFAVPSSQASSSGAADTHYPGRVTAAVASDKNLSDHATANGGDKRLVSTSAAKSWRLATPQRAAQKCRSARVGLAWYRQRRGDWLRLRGVTQTPAGRRAPRSCADARYLAKLWRSRSFAARQAYGRWLNARTLRDFRVTPDSNAWQKAVQEAQRAYPGTRDWLLSCSSTEGGWGRWVPNSDGAPPGGWMQMYESTFWRMFGSARADVEARGFRVPSSAASWYSPLGQALGSAWGLTNGRRGEWAGHGC